MPRNKRSGEWDVSHGITAVAELKARGPYRKRAECTMVSHGITAVAELKHFLVDQLVAAGQVSHGITAVAELKRREGTTPVLGEQSSPTASPPWPN